MSKRESNPPPSGLRPAPPPAPPGIITDNTAVIRALEQRVAELEKVAEEAVKFSVTTGRMSAGLKSALKAAGYLGVRDE